MAENSNSTTENGVSPKEAGRSPLGNKNPASPLIDKNEDFDINPHVLKKMDSSIIDNMSRGEIRKFYTDELGPYKTFIFESAERNNIPPQLLATIILNELSDISTVDVIQDKIFLSLVNLDRVDENVEIRQSIGIAQISVQTAIEHSLTNYPGDSTSFANSLAIARLLDPKFAIEAAAREILFLLGEMVKNRSLPWQKKFGFDLTDIGLLNGPNDLYNFFFINNPTQQIKEKVAAILLAGAYNSPAIILSTADQFDEDSPNFKFKNAEPHAANAGVVSDRIFESPQLFHLKF